MHQALSLCCFFCQFGFKHFFDGPMENTGPHWTIERVIKVKFPYFFLEPAYLVGYAYILLEIFGFGEFFFIF